MYSEYHLIMQIEQTTGATRSEWQIAWLRSSRMARMCCKTNMKIWHITDRMEISIQSHRLGSIEDVSFAKRKRLQYPYSARKYCHLPDMRGSKKKPTQKIWVECNAHFEFIWDCGWSIAKSEKNQRCTTRIWFVPFIFLFYLFQAHHRTCHSTPVGS